MSIDFSNRVALITGGSRGIGRATALRLAREGADIAFSYASRARDAEETAAAIRALGRRAVFGPCDVANRRRSPRSSGRGIPWPGSPAPSSRPRATCSSGPSTCWCRRSCAA